MMDGDHAEYIKGILEICASKSLSQIQNKEYDVKCMVCEGYSNTILYVCESGHFLCKTCRSVEINGPSKEKSKKNLRSLHRPLNILDKNNRISIERELASGDGEKIDDNYEDSRKEIMYSLQQCSTASRMLQSNHDALIHRDDTTKIEDLNIRENKTDLDDDIDKTTIKYKNYNFKESTSSIDSISKNNTTFRKEKSAKDYESNSLARPATCPVTTCGKMLAIDSIWHHFYFDHPKVAKITLKPRKSHRIIQKYNIFTDHTQCVGIFEHQYLSNILQTSILNDNVYAKNNSKYLLFLCVSMLKAPKTTEEIKNAKEITQYKTKVFKSNDNLLLWLCRTTNNTHSCKITLSREDKLLSFSFTGEPIHIRDSQDANSIYDRSNCLIIKGMAANRLLDKDDQFHIFVSIV